MKRLKSWLMVIITKRTIEIYNQIIIIIFWGGNRLKKLTKLLVVIMCALLIFPSNLAWATEDKDTSTHFTREKIIAIDLEENKITLESKKELKLSKTFKVYEGGEGNVTPKEIYDLRIGEENTVVYYNGDEAELVVIDDQVPIRYMKVRISNYPNNKNEDFQNLKIQSKEGFLIVDKDANKLITIGENEEITFDVDTNKISVKGKDYASENTLYLIPINEDSLLKVTNIEKAQNRNPSYRGILEISLNTSTKKLNLLNEVEMEKYLYGVILSEMYSTFDIEALKAQVIAARSVALRKYTAGKSITDNTDDQVYNRIEENAQGIKAVNDTKGKVLRYIGKAITDINNNKEVPILNSGETLDALYYSTSGGFGAWINEIFKQYPTDKFPGVPIPSLSAGIYTYDPQDKNNLLKTYYKTEEDNLKFYKNLAYIGYDSDSEYFRWKIKFTKKELEDLINKNLPMVSKSNPEFVSKTNSDENGIGEIIDIQVVQRGEGGNVMELSIEGTKNTVKLKTHEVISKIFYDDDRKTKIYKSSGGNELEDGSNDLNYQDTVDDIIRLYSTFFAIDKENENIIFYGGGYGHGVGMSQYGANYLATRRELPLKYGQILKTYYPQTLIGKVSYDEVTSTEPIKLLLSASEDIIENVDKKRHSQDSIDTLQSVINKINSRVLAGNLTEEEKNESINELMFGFSIFNSSELKEFSINLISKKELMLGSEAVVRINASNNYSKNNQVTLIVGLYDKNNRLVNYILASEHIDVGQSRDIETKLMLPSNGNYSLKAFVWDSLTSMNPLADVITFQVK